MTPLGIPQHCSVQVENPAGPGSGGNAPRPMTMSRQKAPASAMPVFGAIWWRIKPGIPPKPTASPRPKRNLKKTLIRPSIALRHRSPWPASQQSTINFANLPLVKFVLLLYSYVVTRRVINQYAAKLNWSCVLFIQKDDIRFFSHRWHVSELVQYRELNIFISTSSSLWPLWLWYLN